MDTFKYKPDDPEQRRKDFSLCVYAEKTWRQIKNLDETLSQIYKIRSKNLGIIVKLAVICDAFNIKAWVWKHTVYLYVL